MSGFGNVAGGVFKEITSMKRVCTFVAAGVVIAGVFASGLAIAQAPASPPAASPAPASKPSTASQVETWTKTQWQAAKKEWAKDKEKWAGCRKQSSQQKLDGRKSWSFLYKCMTN